MKTNLKAVKAAINTPEVKGLVAEYLARRVFAEVMRKEVDKITTAILAELPLYDTTGNGERITEPKYVWTCGDDAVLSKFYALCDERERAAGLKPADMPFDYCPALVAEHEQVKAEWALIEATGKPLGVTNDGLLCSGQGKGLENRQKWIDLVVGAVLAIEKEGVK